MPEPDQHPAQSSPESELISGFTLRRPLIGSSGELVGFEFRLAAALEELSELKLKGVRIGRVATDPVNGLKADFVQLAWHSDRSEDLWLQLAAWHDKQPGMPLVVTDVDNIDDLERALRSDVKLVCGGG